MNLPFTSQQFLNVFANYNLAVWPSQLAIYIMALVVVFFLFKKTKYSNKIIATILAFYWLWIAVMYHYLFFAAINPAAKLFAAFFVLQGFLFLYEGVIKSKLEFTFANNWKSYLGLSFMMFGPVIYPILGMLLGHTYPYSPTFGLPCPTTIFTLGTLLLASKLPKHIVIIPFLWSLIGFSAALSLGVKEDISLLITGLTSFAIIMFRNTHMFLHKPVLQFHH